MHAVGHAARWQSCFVLKSEHTTSRTLQANQTKGKSTQGKFLSFRQLFRHCSSCLFHVYAEVKLVWTSNDSVYQNAWTRWNLDEMGWNLDETPNLLFNAFSQWDFRMWQLGLSIDRKMTYFLAKDKKFDIAFWPPHALLDFLPKPAVSKYEVRDLQTNQAITQLFARTYQSEQY